jgi:hypothetical protein
VDVAADQVLQRVIAVEAAAALPELRDPRPDRVSPAYTVTARVVVRSALAIISSPGNSAFSSSVVAPQWAIHCRPRILAAISRTSAAATPGAVRPWHVLIVPDGTDSLGRTGSGMTDALCRAIDPAKCI